MGARLIIFVLAVLVLSGCNMKRWCARRFPPQEGITTVVATDTIYTPKYIKISVPPDTLYLSDTITVNEELSTPQSHLSTEFCLSIAWVEYGRLQHALEQREIILTDTVYLPQISTVETITIEKIHEVPVTPWWHKWVLLALIIIIGILVVRR